MKNTKYPKLGLSLALSVTACQFSASLQAQDAVEVITEQTTLVDGFNVLNQDTTWAAEDTIILRDTVVVPNGLVLTIEPGTTVYSSADDAGTPEAGDDSVGAVVVSRGGQIIAEGTVEEPIIFTAVQELEADCGADVNGDGVVGPRPTATSSGLWGGIILLGQADITNNDMSGSDQNNGQIEGFAPTGTSADGDAFIDVLEYGFDDNFPQDDADNSGILEYVRIQHGGFAFGEGNEINGLTLGGVGSGTTIRFVEIVANSDDGIEFFGGTVNTDHIAVVFCEDDSFDLDNGIMGQHQFWFAIQNPVANRLGEWDGLNGSLTGIVGASAPEIFNATFIGPGLAAGDDDSALFIDDAFSGTLSNSVIAEKENNLADFSSDGSLGSAQITNTTIGTFGNFDGVNDGSVLGSAPDDFYTSSILGTAAFGNTSPNTAVEFTQLERNSGGFLLNLNPLPVVGSSADVGSLAPVPSGLESVSYRGAFAPEDGNPETEENWLRGWSFLDANGFFDGGNVAPALVSLRDAVATDTTLVNGFNVLTADTVWPASQPVFLADTVVVPDGLTLTIEPGAVIYGSADDGGTPEAADDVVGAIVVSRGGTIIADGTPAEPIIFTAIEELEVAQGLDIDGSGQVGPLPSMTSSGLWGGIIVLGNADITLNSDTGTDLNNGQIEGFAPTGVSSDGDAFIDVIEYGFDDAFPRDDADNSGIIRYVRIQHGGFSFGEGNEINGLTLGGVGSGTTIEFVEIVANSDDGIEFFGGTVNTNNIAVVFCGDDSFDLDNGVAGNHQFWFAVQNPDGDRLGEWDGLNGSLADVSGASTPQIYNATFVGPGSNIGDDDSALFIDDAFSGGLFNSVLSEKELNLADFSSDGVLGSFDFSNNVVGQFGNFDGVDASTVLSGAPDNFYVSSITGSPAFGNSQPGTAVQFSFLERTLPEGFKLGGFLTRIDPRPVAGSAADVAPLAAVPAGLETVTYAGAFAPDDGDPTTEENWLAGWSFMAEQGLFEVVPAVLEVVGSGFDPAGDFFISLAEDASGVTVTQSPNLLAGSFTAIESEAITIEGSVITIAASAVDVDGDGRSFFQVFR